MPGFSQPGNGPAPEVRLGALGVRIQGRMGLMRSFLGVIRL
jgi:hypothetical protein